MTNFAAIRPEEWNLPLFIHVLGAFTLVGALAVSATYLFTARRDGSAAAVRLGFRSLLLVALPAFVVMRVAAQWIAAKEDVDDSEAAWITVGYITTDAGLLLLLGATVTAGVAARRLSRGPAEAAPGRGVAVAAWIASLLIVVYGVVIWMMATKPG